MKNNIITTAIFCIASFIVQAQLSIYDDIQFGSHAVGFTQKVIFIPGDTSRWLCETGDLPVYVQIWHPIEKKNKIRYLSHKEFRTLDIPEHLEAHKATLDRSASDYVIDYYLKAIRFDTISGDDELLWALYDEMMNLETRSVPSSFIADTFPVIIYHHGAQNISDDNYVLFEYLASHGFIVLSANANSIRKDSTYRLRSPYQKEDHYLEILMEVAQEISDTKEIHFIGIV